MSYFLGCNTLVNFIGNPRNNFLNFQLSDYSKKSFKIPDIFKNVGIINPDFAKHMIMDLRNIVAFANKNKIEEGNGIEFFISKRLERFIKEDGIHWE